ncbi:hypothetical protein EMPS_08305 [Entomortierella parvispora]|uniref:RlpA-like protein double-psi beta-barrel domain-containing protein n=1 Tax=Entomortierella parvispora TaxID=205924 RepID=A0A9P3HGM0_9FUNG|nr:hypothetical protein EMPS_08305 [Entomortierella parvispora]
MAPIPRFTSSPLSIITSALFTAFSAPGSSPPSNGSNATVWGADYTGTASYLNATLLVTPTSPTPSATSSLPTPTSTSTASSTPTSSPSSSPVSSPTIGTSNSTLVYYNTKTDTYTGCNNQTFSPTTDNVVLMNPLQFGALSASNTTCGQWISIQNRENTLQSAVAQVVGVCDECPYGSIQIVNLDTLQELAPSVPFDEIMFESGANTTLADMMDPITPLLPNSTVISPNDLINIVWTLTDAPVSTSVSPSSTTTSTPTPTKTTTTSTVPSPTQPASPEFTGRGTWYSDTNGQCGHSYSQSDMIVAVNQAQMGTGTKICGEKLAVTAKGSSATVIVTVVDMCPSQYCSKGDLDLSQAAFKKLASGGLNEGVLEVEWSFV